MHWFVICRREHDLYEIFDSLGTSSTAVKNILKIFFGKCDFNETALQAKESSACGEFCIFFAVQRYFNEDLDFAELLNEYFTTDFIKNEQSVKKFLNNE